MRPGRWFAHVSATLAQINELKSSPGFRKICSGTYSSRDWSGSYDPEISISFSAGDVHNRDNATLGSQLAVVVYSIKDETCLGIPTADNRIEFICTQAAIAQGLCSSEDRGKFLINPDIQPSNSILSEKIDLPSSKKITYEIVDTSYYCVAAARAQACRDWHSDTGCHDLVPIENDDDDNYAFNYDINVVFRNSFGYLEASKASLVRFYFSLACICAATLLLWLVFTYKNQKYAITIHREISAFGALLTCRQLVLGFYYLTLLREKSSTFVLWLVSTNDTICTIYGLSLFLSIFAGYSILHDCLNPRRKLYLALICIFTFVPFLLYTADTLYSAGNGGSTSLFGIGTFFPVMVVMVIDYITLMNDASAVKTSLEEKNHISKAHLYARLQRVLRTSAVFACSYCIFILLLNFSSSFSSFHENFWMYTWILTVGWPEVLCILTVFSLASIIRPSPYLEDFQKLAAEDVTPEFVLGTFHGDNESEDEFELN